jgi:CelD/BcsL family acetyltransferase involved in cellulose biosynthesis
MTWTLISIDQFREVASEWDRLLRSNYHAPFLESAFISPLLDEFGDGSEVLALHRTNAGLLAGAILRPLGKGRWETFQPSQLPLGAWIASPEVDIAEQMRELLRQLPGLPLSLGITQLDSMLQPRPADQATLRTQDYINTAWVDVVGSFDTYWDSLGKNLRQNTKKQRNKLGNEGIETTLECLTAPDQVAQAMEDYGALESAGWKAANGTAIHPDNAQGRFYRKMLENFCEQKRARIYRYRFGDKVVSMDLCILCGPVIVILKTAYDEAQKTVSPSTLMRQDEFKLLFDEGSFQRIEFYGKIMEWHTRWTGNSRPIYHATQYRWPVIKSLHLRLARHRQIDNAGETKADT